VAVAASVFGEARPRRRRGLIDLGSRGVGCPTDRAHGPGGLAAATGMHPRRSTRFYSTPTSRAVRFDAMPICEFVAEANPPVPDVRPNSARTSPPPRFGNGAESALEQRKAREGQRDVWTHEFAIERNGEVTPFRNREPHKPRWPSWVRPREAGHPADPSARWSGTESSANPIAHRRHLMLHPMLGTCFALGF
jgi:hypothetical protein